MRHSTEFNSFHTHSLNRKATSHKVERDGSGSIEERRSIDWMNREENGASAALVIYEVSHVCASRAGVSVSPSRCCYFPLSDPQNYAPNECSV